jgi:hypothetical protein
MAEFIANILVALAIAGLIAIVVIAVWVIVDGTFNDDHWRFK